MKTITISDKWIPSKDSINGLVDKILKPIENGEVNVLQAQATVSALEQVLDTVSKTIKPLVLDEIAKFPKGQIVQSNGVRFDSKEAGAKYDYSECGDLELNDLVKQAAELDLRIKERQTFLKGIKGTEMLTYKQTGEIIEVHPPKKKSTTTFVTTFY